MSEIVQGKGLEMMKGKKGLLTYTIVKATAWNHNICIIKLGFSPLQLVTGKTEIIPGPTIEMRKMRTYQTQMLYKQHWTQSTRLSLSFKK